MANLDGLSSLETQINTLSALNIESILSGCTESMEKDTMRCRGSDPEHENNMLPLSVIEQNDKIASDKRGLSTLMEDFQRCDVKDLHCWNFKHPDEWESLEVLAWISELALKSPGIDFKTLHSERFNQLTGMDLRCMSLSKFEQLEPIYGAQIHSAFNKCISETNQLPPMNLTNRDAWHNDSSSFDIDDVIAMGSSTGDHVDTFHETPDHRTPMQDPGCTCGGGYFCNCYTERWIESTCIGGNDEHLVIDEVTKPTPKRGRPNKNGGLQGQRSVCLKTSGQRKYASKGSHLYQFHLELLLNKNYNPSHIRWVSKDEGIFCIVKSSAVARMWGDRKNNSTMTYDKMSRAMRYYYKTGILIPVKGHRLAYQFGPSVSGWQHADATSSHATHRLDDPIQCSLTEWP